MTTKPTLLSSLALAACASNAHPTPDTPAADPRAVQVGLVVRLEVKAGHESEVAQLLRDGQALVAAEPGTTYWFALQIGPTTFGIFDAFPTSADRDAHLAGKLASALLAKAPEVLAQDPTIEKVDIVGKKDAVTQPLRVGLLARLEAKPEHAQDVATLMAGGAAIVADEPATALWFGIQVSPTTYAIFDAFADDAGRDAHLAGKLAQTLVAKAPELLASPPVIEKVDLLATQIR